MPPTWRKPGQRPFEFMRRVLQHVPPRGLHRVRSYGLYHHAHKDKLEAARAILQPPRPLTTKAAIAINLVAPPSPHLPRCPYCNSTNLVTLQFFMPRPRPPPSVLVGYAMQAMAAAAPSP